MGRLHYARRVGSIRSSVVGGKGLYAAMIALVIVVGTGLAGATPIVDAVSHRAVTDATLITPVSYDLLAPICNTLDVLSLLSLRQHIALFLTLIAVMLVWRTIVHRRDRTRWTRELRSGVLAFVVWLAVYAGGVLVPRPMAAIKLYDPDDIAVDFHSHTNSSWDGRHSFTPERNRAWHTGAGFSVAYISDHKSLVGARRGGAGNASTPNGQTILLPALESRDHHEHVIVIGVDTTAAVDAKGEWHDPGGDTALAYRLRAPFLILTIPGNIVTLTPNEERGVARVLAIELSDAAPRGLNQIQRDERGILELADRLHLAVVAGSDNHGWGSTAAAWSVMHIPGWIRMRPSQLDSAIQWTIREQGRSAVRVYLRHAPNPGTSRAALAVTFPAIVWCMLVDMSWPERSGWIIWICVVVLLAYTYYSIWPRTKKATEAN
jgi:hypothetical protein